MNHETWQRLLSLESRDITQQWFYRIHSRELNAQRTLEINSAAKQAREYFRNAEQSDYSVRPLLTFYGVSSLSRALLLLLKSKGGEEGLKGSHGLETLNWGATMSGDTSAGLKDLGNLKIRTRSGLFSDFVKYTNNRIAIHVRSAGVDWSLCYDNPSNGTEISFDDLLSRIPDLELDYSNLSDKIRHASVNGMTYSDADGFEAKVLKRNFAGFQSSFETVGYSANCDGNYCTLTCDKDTFSKHPPIFVHTHVQKMFESIPELHIAEPFCNDSKFSELSTTYMVAYILGMLVRYYPTHWTSLIQGGKGDALWPTINRSQQYVELAYPELVSEMISYILKISDESPK